MIKISLNHSGWFEIFLARITHRLKENYTKEFPEISYIIEQENAMIHAFFILSYQWNPQIHPRFWCISKPFSAIYSTYLFVRNCRKHLCLCHGKKRKERLIFEARFHNFGLIWACFSQSLPNLSVFLIEHIGKIYKIHSPDNFASFGFIGEISSL